MGKLSKDTKGFSVFELLLLIIIIILVGFVGWYVYHTDHKTAGTVSSTNSTKTKTTAETTSYFTIAEWGVRAPYSGDLTLEYSSPTGSDPSDTNISSSQLDAADAMCKASGNGGGNIERYASTDVVVNEDGSSSGQTPAQYLEDGGFGGYTGGKYSKVGNYYYFFVQPQGLCGADTSSVTNVENQTINAAKSVVENLQAVPST